MACWLLKSEPSVFSWDHLCAQPGRRTAWEGVRNYQARNLLRDTLQPGDWGLFYHSNADPTAAVGVVRIVRAGYPDPSARDKKSDYYDAKAAAKEAKGLGATWYVVDVEAHTPFLQPVTRPMLQEDKRTADMMVLKRGARLSVQPVTAAEFAAVCALGGIKVPK